VKYQEIEEEALPQEEYLGQNKEVAYGYDT